MFGADLRFLVPRARNVDNPGGGSSSLDDWQEEEGQQKMAEVIDTQLVMRTKL